MIVLLSRFVANTKSACFARVIGGVFRRDFDGRVDTSKGALAEKMADNIFRSSVGLMDDGGWLTAYTTMMHTGHRMLRMRMSRNGEVVRRLKGTVEDRTGEGGSARERKRG